MDDWVREYRWYRGDVLLPDQGRTAFLPPGVFDMHGSHVHGCAGRAAVCGFGHLGEQQGAENRRGNGRKEAVSVMEIQTERARTDGECVP